MTTSSRNKAAFVLLVLAVVGYGVVQLSEWHHQQSQHPTTWAAVQDKEPPIVYPHKPAQLKFVLTPEEFHQQVTGSFDGLLGRRPLCTREQIIHGTWIPEQLERPPYITPTKHLRCYSHDTYYNDAQPWNTYQWQPHDASRRVQDECALTRWDRDRFCGLMSGATVSIVGDSLSWEQYASLVQLNGVKTHQGYQHQSRELLMNVGQPVCDGHTRIVYRRDDKLQNLTHAIQDDFPTVLILNRGAHYVNDTLLLHDIRHNIAEVREWLTTCQTVYNTTCHFFWRTSVPGHPECGQYSSPVNDLRLMERRVSDLSFYDERSINFHWYDYQHQNQLVVKELERSDIPYQVIDAYYLNMLRPDEHRAHQGDCLHNCYPGKMDVYNQLLLHYLRTDRTREDMLRAEIVARAQGWNLAQATEYNKEATEAARERRVGNG